MDDSVFIAVRLDNFFVSSRAGCPRAYQIEKRQQENPYHIDKMPIQTPGFDRRMKIGSKVIAVREPCQDEHDGDADDEVQGVQAGEAVVKNEEQFDMLRPHVKRGPLGRIERPAWN